MEKINTQIEAIDTPFAAGYYAGMELFQWLFEKQLWLTLIIIGFILPPLLSKDSVNGINELSLSSKHGRRKNMNARIIVGNIFGVGAYLLTVLVLVIEIGAVASFQGFGLPMQNLRNTCPFNMTMGSGMMVMFFHGLLTVIIITNFIMLLSIILKRSKISILVSLLLLLFLSTTVFSNNSLLEQLSPVSLATKYNGSPYALNISYFIGDMMIPYILSFVVIGISYLALIRIATLRQYKKYKLN